MGLGGDGALARSDDAQHALWLLHPDIDIGGVAGGVEPERLVQPRRQRLLQGPVDHTHRAASRLVGQGRTILKNDGQGHGPLGAVGDDRHIAGSWVVAPAFGRPGDVAGQSIGQPGGHRLPVHVEEGPGDGHLHDQHRQDDDQQRPSPQRGRHLPLQEPRPQRGWQKSQGPSPLAGEGGRRSLTDGG